MAMTFVTLPMHGTDEVDICVDEIAAMREHTVVSYSYEKWTEVTLQSGAKFDCRIAKAELVDKLQRAYAIRDDEEA